MSELKMEGEAPKPDVRGKQPKKKSTKQTKKSLVSVENIKRQKCFQTLLGDGSMSPFVMEVFTEEEKMAGYILELNSIDIERFWGDIQEFLTPRIDELLGETKVNHSIIDDIEAVVNLLQYTSTIPCVDDSEKFTQMACTLNSVMTRKNMFHEELQNQICKLSETCCLKNLQLRGEFYLNTFNCLFDLTLNEKQDVNRKPEVKRMWQMHTVLSKLNLRSQSCDTIVSKLQRVVVSPVYLSCKEGRQFIAFTFVLDTKLIKKFHQTVKHFLASCKRSFACQYGEVYYSAWTNSSTEIRQVLEMQCIQNLMTHMFVFPRKGLEMSLVAQNTFAILSYLHHNRTTPHFSKTLTELYMPLLWRHLRSGNSVERCNAADVFLDIYPLEKPGSGKVEECNFLSKQHNEMVDLLTDHCHIVRIIATRGICEKLYSAWGTFPPDIVQVLMRNLVALTYDSSISVVRSTLFNSLRMLLLNPESAKYLARVLPSLSDSIHDVNESVRCSFVKLLCDVKAMPEPPPIRYWKIVSINHLAARLEEEKPEVGSVLSKLLMSNIYSTDYSTEKFLTRLIKFIEMSPKAARRLFMFSEKVLDYKNAIRVMLMILLNLRASVRKKEEASAKLLEENQKQAHEVEPKKKKRRSFTPLQPIIENEQNVSGDSEDKENKSPSDDSSTSKQSVSSINKLKVEEEVDEYSKPEVSHALIDIVTVLWSIHSKKLMYPENETDHNNLLDLTCSGIPLFLKHFKGKPSYFAVIHLASLVPASKLTPVSTICSACVSHLKQVTEVTPEHEIQVIVHALCSWNRFADIQDLVIDWLDQAFRCEGLNQSQALVEELKKRRVRFLPKGGKPMLALRLLDAVFVHPLNSLRVMGKSYKQVYELYVYMNRIKTLIERRLLLDVPFDSPMLNDDFLAKCFYRYTKLILILHKPEIDTSNFSTQSLSNSFDASAVFSEFIVWSNCVIKPLLPQALEDEPNLSVSLVNDILRTTANLSDLNYLTTDTAIRIGEFIKSVLSLKCCLWFVERSMATTKFLKDYAQATFGQDNNKIMNAIVPCLLSQVLKSLTDTAYTKDQITGCIKNVTQMKVAMFEVLHSLLKMYSPQSHLLKSVLKLFTDALIAVISYRIKKVQLLNLEKKIADLPYVCGLLLPIVCRPVIASCWLATISSSISDVYFEDGDLLASVVSLLYTLAHCGLPLPKQELIAAVKKALPTVNNHIKNASKSVADQSNSSISSEAINVKEEVIPVLYDLGAFLNCPFR